MNLNEDGPSYSPPYLGIGVSLVSLMYYSAGIWVKPWQEAFGWTRAVHRPIFWIKKLWRYLVKRNK